MKPTAFPIKYCLIILLFLLNTKLNAQTNGLNFNMNLQFETQKQDSYPSGSSSTTVQRSKESDLSFTPSLAYLRFTPNSNFHLFELARIGFEYYDRSTKVITPDETIVTNGAKTFDLTLAARYSHYVSLSSNDRFQPFIGLGIVPKFQRTVMEPKVSSYKTATTDLGADLEIIGTALFNLSKHLKMNISLPIKIWSGGHEWSRVDNPSIPVNQRTDTKFQKEFFPPRFEIKVGVIYQFRKGMFGDTARKE